MVTTCANIQSFKTGIPVSTLTQTVQDAIEATRNLGYSYLWIDALCIIQDSNADKAVEISKMAQIYCDSVLTISAEEAACATEGFLKTHGQLATDSENERVAVNVPFRHPNGVQGYLDLYKSAVPSTEPTGAIHKRAWTFQEHFLSRRVLYFGRDLHWECFKGKISNSGTAETFESVGFMSRDLDLAPDRPDEAIYFAWVQIVEKLMLRGISDPQDRLNALSGIALNFGKRLGDVYLAGIWQKDFATGLCWYLDPGPRPSAQIDRFGPTWSWSSLSHPTLHLSHAFSPSNDSVKAELLGSGTGLAANTSQYGQVNAGTLNFRGVLQKFDHHSFTSQFEFEDKVATNGLNERQDNRVWLDEDKSSAMMVTPQDFWLFEILLDNCSRGLVLRKVLDETFKRVGFFRGHIERVEMSTIGII